MGDQESWIAELFDLAVGNHRRKDPQTAETQYRQILSRDPRHVGALHMLGLLVATLGRRDEAVELLREAIRLRPSEPEIHYNLAKLLKQAGQLGQSVEEYRHAIALRPEFPEALNNLGNVLAETGDPVAAAHAYQRAVAARPNYPEANFNFGKVLCEMGSVDEAIASYRAAISLRPRYPEAWNNLGLALTAKEDLDEAVAAFRQALLLRPGYVDALGNLGNALKDRGDLDEATECFRLAAAGNPDPRPAGNLLMSLLYRADCTPETIYREHVAWNQTYAKPLAQFMRPHANEPDPDRRLRVGYVSPHLNAHVVGRYVLPLLQHHNHEQFEVFCYSDSRVVDSMSSQIRSLADSWRGVTDLTEEEIASQIRSDRIDVLVDLTMHMNQNRLLVFAHKPAPVQITWLGYPGTTGLTTMDYRISDPYLDPADGDGDKYYSEKTIRLPHTYWCFPPPPASPEVGPLPAISNGFVTFGCLSAFCKVSPPIVAAWAGVLARMPDSRLLVLAPPGSARDRLNQMLAERGVAPERVEAVGRQPFADYLKLYNRIDIGLDTFPYNGHTTSLDALWSGVPFVTLKGTTVVSRGGASILSNVGLPDLVAASAEEYIEVAGRLAGDLPRLSKLRSTLRQRTGMSPLTDATHFTGDMERIYRQVWKEWCAAVRASARPEPGR